MGFPTVIWRKERATFAAYASDGFPMPAALVFPFYGDKIVLAEIPGRGWCIPSGRLEPGETPEVRRGVRRLRRQARLSGA
nr:NUDIX domain-containing protein [Armatimonas sp.]